MKGLRLMFFFYRKHQLDVHCNSIYWFLYLWYRNSLNLNELTNFSLALHFIKKPVIWFPIQIKRLVSIWNATLGLNEIKTNATHVLRCAILVLFVQFKNVKNTHVGVLLLVLLVKLLVCFSRFLKLYKWYQITQCISLFSLCG